MPAGAAGFEPAHGGIKTRCLTAWLRPITTHYDRSRPPTPDYARLGLTLLEAEILCRDHRIQHRYR